MICESTRTARWTVMPHCGRIRANTSASIASDDQRQGRHAPQRTWTRRTSRGCMMRETNRSRTERPRNSRNTSSAGDRRDQPQQVNPARFGETELVHGSLRNREPLRSMAQRQQAQAGTDEVGEVLGVLQVLHLRHFRAFQRVDFAIDGGQRLLVHGPEVLAARLFRDLLERRFVDFDGARRRASPVRRNRRPAWGPRPACRLRCSTP